MTQKEITGYRASPQQEHLWFVQQADNSTAYRSQCGILIEGELDAGTLRASLHDILNRHETLRTTLQYSPNNGALVQIIAKNASFILEESSLEGMYDHDQEHRLGEIFREMGGNVFNYEKGPLFRTRLVRLSHDKHILFLAAPTLCADAASLRNLARDLIYAYGGLLRRNGWREESMQYADFAQWQREVFESGLSESGSKYWRRKNFGELTALNLPLRKAKGRNAPFEPSSCQFRLRADLARKIENVSRTHGATIHSFLLCAWITLLWRHTQRSETVVGIRCDGRKYAEQEGAVGLFARYLPARFELSDRVMFSQLLIEVMEIIEAHHAWQEIFKWEEIDEAKKEKEPYCAVSYEIGSEPEWQNVRDIRLRVDREYECIDRFEIKLRCLKGREEWKVSLDYDAELYEAAYIERLGRQYEKLLESAAIEPLGEVAKLAMLSESEQRELVVDLNRTEERYGRAESIHELIAERSRGLEDAIALVFEGNCLSYEEMNRRANKLARHLRKCGVGKEVKVGVCLERGLEMVIGLIAILKAGGAYVPLDPEYPGYRLDYIIKDASINVLLARSAFLEKINGEEASVIDIEKACEASAKENDSNFDSGVSGENLAYVIYTSGSTGKPKGVMIEHRGVVNYLSWCARFYLLEEGTGSVVHSSISFDLTVTSLFAPLASGKRVVLVKEEPGLEALAETLRRERNLSLVKITPAHLKLLGQQLDPEEASDRTRSFIIGGEALLLEHIAFWQKNAPETKLINEYGPTEAVVGCCVYQIPGEIENSRIIPIGRPIYNTKLYILDSDLQPVPVGVAGELYIGGAGLTNGYLNHPELTAEKIIPHPFSAEPGARLYKTGDEARFLPDGNIDFLGRLDHQVKIRGYRIEVGEVEFVLDQCHGVRQSVLMARENPSGEKRLVAYLEVDGIRPPTVEQLRNYLKEKLPEYMLPSAWVFLDALPLTSNGKVDRRALPAPEWSKSPLKESFVAPETEVEQRLAEIWSQALGLERVGIRDNFFKLGGDSILSIQIISRARQAGYQLTARDLFQHQTIAKLAAVVDRESKLRAEQGIVTGEVPLTPIQERFFESHFAEPSYYNHSVRLEVKQAPRAAVFETALRFLLWHHDALRLRYIREEGIWKQFNAEPEEELPFMEIDLSGLPEPIREGVMEELDHQLQSSLNLEQGPLVRMTAFELGAEAGMRVSMIMHHLVVDVVSWRILLEDFERVCDQVRKGRPVDFPAKTTSYQQWAEQLKRYAGSEEMVEEAERWMNEVGGEARGLPVDYEYGENSEESSRIVEITLEREETESLLRNVSQRYQTQIEGVLLGALRQSLGSWLGKCRVLVDVERHGREELFGDLDVSRTVGWFTTIHPVLLECEEDVGSGGRPIEEVSRCDGKRGISYGLLRYQSELEEVREKMREQRGAELSFNYLGQLDRVLEGSGIKIVEEKSGARMSGRDERRYLLSITGRVMEKRLHVEWSYSEKKHKRETIERLGERFKEALQATIIDCSGESEEKYTPMDFPEAGLSQEQLDQLMLKYGQNVESIATQNISLHQHYL